MSSTSAEIGPNDIIIHLVNPFKCLDCGTEFFHQNLFLQHLGEHMDRLKSQHPCFQMVCGINLAAQPSNSITVTKDILQINENQMFELQDPSLDPTQLTPIKTLEQFGIICLPAREKAPQPPLSNVPSNSPPVRVNFAPPQSQPQPLLQQRVIPQGLPLVSVHSGTSSSAGNNLDVLGKCLDESQLNAQHIDFSNLQNLQSADPTSDLQTLVQQALLDFSGEAVDNSNSNNNNTTNNTVHVQDTPTERVVGQVSATPRINSAMGLELWPNQDVQIVQHQNLPGVKHIINVTRQVNDSCRFKSDLGVVVNDGIRFKGGLSVVVNNGSRIKGDLSTVVVEPSNNAAHVQGERIGHVTVPPPSTKGLERWKNENAQQSLASVKQVTMFKLKEMADSARGIRDNPLECDVCFSRFPSRAMLMRHRTIHWGGKSLSCLKCFKHFHDISSLDKHIKTHKRSHQCPVCLKMFLHRRQMELHLAQHKKKRFVQFGHKYHEVQVSTSRNGSGQIVHEYSLSILLKAKNGQPEKCDDKNTQVVNDAASSEHLVQLTGDSTSTSPLREKTCSFMDTRESVGKDDVNSDKPQESLRVSKIVYRCGHCKKCINTRPTLSRHLMLHTNEKPYRCQECGKNFRHKNDLIHHGRTHSKPVKCLSCGSAFSKEIYRQNHLQKGCPFLESENDKFTVLSNLKYRCNSCSKVLKTKSNIIRHLRVHAFGNGESDSKKISRNINDTTANRVIDDNCDERVTEGESMSGNVQDYFKPLNNSVGFLCTICNETFRFKTFVQIHVRMHLGQRSFKCKDCGKGFYGSYMLRKHEQNHTRPFKCPKCGQGFTRRYLMSHHFRKSHNQEAEDKMKDITCLRDDKLLSCDICGKTMPSYQKSLMQYHIRGHKDVRPHQCKVCGKDFISDIHLKKHSLNHSRPYICQVCNQGFSRRYLMLDHFSKNCKSKLKKLGTKQSGWSETDSETVVVPQAASVLNTDQEPSVTPHETPYHVEVVSEIDEAKGMEIFKCVPCNKAFTVRDALSKHVKRFMRSTSCKYCKTAFEDKHLTLAHQRSCLGIDISVQVKAGTRDKSPQTIGKQQKIVITTMKEMSSKIKSLTSVKTHGKVVQNPRPVDSNDIDIGSSSSLLGTDLVEHDASNSPTLQSNLDESVNTSMKTPTLKVKEKNMYPCPNCSKSFSTPRGLKIHAFSHVRLYKCDTCGGDFTRVGKFRQHLKSHSQCNQGEGSRKDSEENTFNDNDDEQPKPADQIEDNARGRSVIVSKSSVNKFDKKVKLKESDEMNKDLVDGRENERISSESEGLGGKDVRHQLLKTGTRGRPFSCLHCRRRFTEESGLKEHLLRIHGGGLDNGN